jgi:hypothetical protein
MYTAEAAASGAHRTGAVTVNTDELLADPGYAARVVAEAESGSRSLTLLGPVRLGADPPSTPSPCGCSPRRRPATWICAGGSAVNPPGPCARWSTCDHRPERRTRRAGGSPCAGGSCSGSGCARTAEGRASSPCGMSGRTAGECAPSRTAGGPPPSRRSSPRLCVRPATPRPGNCSTSCSPPASRCGWAPVDTRCCRSGCVAGRSRTRRCEATALAAFARPRSISRCEPGACGVRGPDPRPRSPPRGPRG